MYEDKSIDNATATTPHPNDVTVATALNTVFVTEDFSTSGDTLMSQISDLIGQGNIHRIAIKNSEGHTLLSVPAHQGEFDARVATIPSAEAMAINVIGAIVDYPKIIVERFI